MAKIYVTPKYVIKIGSRGESQLNIEPEDEQHFARVVLVDVKNRWLIQERVDCVPNQAGKDEHLPIIQYLTDKYGINDIGMYPPIPHNWTVTTKGIPVIFDYDFNSSRKYITHN